MKVTHTPGPWRVGKKYVTDIYPNDGGMLVARVMTGGISNNKSHANARLIAAAPELLAALQSIAETVVYAPEGGHEEVSDCVRIAKQAIAKATGATP